MSPTAPSLSERLASDITSLIHAERLKPGDTLTSARELAARFEVTTPTIREALRRLEAIDVVQMRHGSGTYVGPGITRSVIANPHRPPITRASVLELADARLALEPRIAALAATHRDPEALARLEESVANALTAPTRGDRPRLHFHIELAATTGNTLLRQTMEALLTVRSGEQVEIRFTYDNREQDYREHRAILDAVRAGDASIAERLTIEHLTSIRDAIATAEFVGDDTGVESA